ncbi:hypothetical protein [Glutamicibacter soli]
MLCQQLLDGIRISVVLLPHRASTNLLYAQANLEIEVRAHDAAPQQEGKDNVLCASRCAALVSS